MKIETHSSTGTFYFVSKAGKIVKDKNLAKLQSKFDKDSVSNKPVSNANAVTTKLLFNLLNSKSGYVVLGSDATLAKSIESIGFTVTRNKDSNKNITFIAYTTRYFAVTL